MEYVLLRYKQRPDAVVGLASTSNPGEAVQLVRRWAERAPDEGVIVAIEQRPIVHCAPRSA